MVSVHDDTTLHCSFTHLEIYWDPQTSRGGGQHPFEGQRGSLSVRFTASRVHDVCTCGQLQGLGRFGG